MDDSTPGRRGVLRRAGRLVAVAGVGGLAGCNAGEDGSGPTSTQAGGQDGGGSTPTQDDGPYRQWLYAPSSVSSREHYSFTSRKPAEIAAHESALSDETYSTHETAREEWQPLGLAFDDVDRLLSYFTTTVVIADIDVGTTAETLTDSGFEESGSHLDYDLYAADDRVAAVTEGSVVFAKPTLEVDSETLAIAAIDARTGNGERYVQTNDAMMKLMRHSKDGTLVYGSTSGLQTDQDQVGEQLIHVGQAMRFRMDGDVTHMRQLFVFPDSADTAMMKDRVENAEWYDRVRDVEYGTDGVVGTISGTIPTEKL